MYKSTLLALALTSIASAQSTTSLYLFGMGDYGVVASVLKSDSAATTYSIACADSSDDDCPIPTSLTMTQGPSTIHMDYQTTATAYTGTSMITASIDFGCTITDSKSGSCSETLIRDYKSSRFSSATTTLITDAAEDLYLQEVTLSAGVIGNSASTAVVTATGTKSGLTTKTGTSSTAAVTGSSAGSSGATSTGSSTSLATTSSASSLASGSSSSAGAASSSTASTAGMPMITGNAQWVIGGAAAAIALAAM